MADKNNNKFDPKIPSTSGEFPDPKIPSTSVEFPDPEIPSTSVEFPDPEISPSPTPSTTNPFGDDIYQSMVFCNVNVGVIYNEGQVISNDDWLGAFVGETLVGVRQWDTSQCNSNICNIQIMGSDGNPGTTLYAIPGDMITYKIYIESTGVFLPITGYTIQVEGRMNFITVGPWDGTFATNGFFYIESLRQKMSGKNLTPDEFSGLLRQKGGRVGGEKR